VTQQAERVPLYAARWAPASETGDRGSRHHLREIQRLAKEATTRTCQGCGWPYQPTSRSGAERRRALAADPSRGLPAVSARGWSADHEEGSLAIASVSELVAYARGNLDACARQQRDCLLAVP